MSFIRYIKEIRNLVVLVGIAMLLPAGCGSLRSTGNRGGQQSPSERVDKPATQPRKPKPRKPAPKGSGWLGDVNHNGKPWVSNLSRSNSIARGLDGSHLSVWASHGRYYNIAKKRWEWQRVNLFCTNEDLFTQTFVVPYLIPMLEKAGAVVWTPRERDWQPNEFVIDNDNPHIYAANRDSILVRNFSDLWEYRESGTWKTSEKPGFANSKTGFFKDGDTPFTAGTVRYTHTTRREATASVTYTPELRRAGRYAVYVSYQTDHESVDDAHYTVYHAGQKTEFSVNQQMGGGTWVYLGTFYFNNNDKHLNCVVLDNNSHSSGIVTTDAVRFGGGIGNVSRGGTISGLTRANEGARYTCEYAGAPYSIYSQRGGTDDYADDINCRSMMTNWLAGGSCYIPDTVGLRVPLELSLALHSDAGFHRDFKSIYGSLGICTTDYNGGLLATGFPRSHSKDFAKMLTRNLENDLKKTYGSWVVRDLYDRNYSETRRPEVPSAILEMLSHQSLPDMKLAHDPQFKFVTARSIYKSVLRFVAESHGHKYVIAPLSPVGFRTELSEDGVLKLHWAAQADSLEPTAVADSYKLYVATGANDFDNGSVIKTTSAAVRLIEGVLYRFKVAACNAGGESFCTEELAAIYRKGMPVVLVANGFHRLAGPQVCKGGFDVDADPGVSYGLNPSILGRQQVFDTSLATGEGVGTFGYCGDDYEGSYIAGNDFNYTTTHVRAIATAGRYSAISCDARELIMYKDLDQYPIIDLILGNERNDGYSLTPAATFPPILQNILRGYSGGLFISGSYVASDAQTAQMRSFLANRLNVALGSQNRDGSSVVKGMGLEIGVYRTLNDQHYASTASDVLQPKNRAFSVIAYSDGSTAAVATPGESFVMGFPFECIKSESQRTSIMAAILSFLEKK